MLLRVSAPRGVSGLLLLLPALLTLPWSLVGCNSPLPKVLREPAILEGAAAVTKARFARVPDGTEVLSLRRDHQDHVVALTRKSAVWFDSRGELIREVGFDVQEPLLYTSFVLTGEDGFRIAGQLQDRSVVLLAPDGSLEDRLPGILGGAYAVGDVGADGDLEVLTSARRDLRCPWPKLCTSLVVHDLVAETPPAAADTPYILTDLEVVPPGQERAGQVVLLMYPNASGGARFEVWDPELRPLSGWDSVRLGGFSLAEREGSLRVLTAEGESLVFRDLEGELAATLPLPLAGRLRNPRWNDLGAGWGVGVVSGVESRRFLVAVYDPDGRLVYREVSSPHAQDLLVFDHVPGKFLVPVGSEIVAYTVEAVPSARGSAPGGAKSPSR